MAEPSGIEDAIANPVQWLTYPELARRFGARGGTQFVRQRAALKPGEPRELSLPEFVEQCYGRYYMLPIGEVEAGLPTGTKQRLEGLLS